MTDLLELRDLSVRFDTGGETVQAVNAVDLQLRAGTTLGLVGESGSGKSVTALSIMGLLPASAEVAGTASFHADSGSVDLLGLSEQELRRVRGCQIAMIFQEPGTSLNPVYRIGTQIGEVLRLHEGLSRAAARERSIELLEEVGIPEPTQRIDSYPHELSGGQKQRVMIAMALSCNPRLLIADEPTTALDVTIQAQILDLLRRLRDERQMAMLFISHDLGVVAEIADEVAVMLDGSVIEQAATLDLYQGPREPYTRGLLECRPRFGEQRERLPTVADVLESQSSGAGGRKVSGSREPPGETQRRRLLHPRSALEVPEGEARPGGAPQAGAIEEGTEPLLSVRDLSVHFPIRRGLLRRTRGWVRAVDGVGFDLYRGQTLGLVGESGCGKTTTGLAVLRLLGVTEGAVTYDGIDLLALSGARLRRMRSRMQIVLQDPYASLNPRLSVGSVLTEAMSIHGLGESRDERLARAADLLVEVGLETAHLHRYPHEFSGGQRQRISIARALAVDPEFMVLDESVSALDVSIQAQVLNLLRDLQERRGLSFLFISHDLSVVEFMSDMLAVMRAGRFVEFGPANEVVAYPRSEYTQELIEAVPDDSIGALQRRAERRASTGDSSRPVQLGVE